MLCFTLWIWNDVLGLLLSRLVAKAAPAARSAAGAVLGLLQNTQAPFEWQPHLTLDMLCFTLWIWNKSRLFRFAALAKAALLKLLQYRHTMLSVCPRSCYCYLTWLLRPRQQRVVLSVYSIHQPAGWKVGLHCWRNKTAPFRKRFNMGTHAWRAGQDVSQEYS